jgi:hypothetical protein
MGPPRRKVRVKMNLSPQDRTDLPVWSGCVATSSLDPDVTEIAREDVLVAQSNMTSTEHLTMASPLDNIQQQTV